MNLKFYKCANCGQMIAKVKDTGLPVVCCGKEMMDLIPGSIDASQEKHVPVYEIKDDQVTVTVGSIEHPMAEEHYIEWIALQTKAGNQRKELKPGMAPKVCFALCEGDEVEAVYAYCNLHGLWKG